MMSSVCCSINLVGRSDGAMVLGKRQVPVVQGPLRFQKVQVGVVWTFFLSFIISLLSFSLWETKILFQWAVKPTQPTQPTLNWALNFLSNYPNVALKNKQIFQISLCSVSKSVKHNLLAISRVFT